jgi:hypothetical protein
VKLGSDIMTANKKMHDLRALAQAYLLIWTVTIIVMLDDDAAMLALVFS